METIRLKSTMCVFERETFIVQLSTRFANLDLERQLEAIRLGSSYMSSYPSIDFGYPGEVNAFTLQREAVVEKMKALGVFPPEWDPRQIEAGCRALWEMGSGLPELGVVRAMARYFTAAAIDAPVPLGPQPIQIESTADSQPSIQYLSGLAQDHLRFDLALKEDFPEGKIFESSGWIPAIEKCSWESAEGLIIQAYTRGTWRDGRRSSWEFVPDIDLADTHALILVTFKIGSHEEALKWIRVKAMRPEAQALSVRRATALRPE